MQNRSNFVVNPMDPKAKNNAALCDAADLYEVERIRSLLGDGADVNTADQNGMTPLHFAANYDYSEESDRIGETITLLLEAGADVNLVNEDGWTPMHYAVFRMIDCNLQERLIGAGADLLIRNKEGQMPIHIPLEFGRTNDVRFLARFYEDKDIDIFVSTKIGRLDRIAKILDEYPAAVDFTDSYGSTPLMYAARIQNAPTNQAEIVKVLLDRGANPNIQNQGGITALHVADRPDVIKHLLEFGADPTIRDIKGETPSLL